MAVEVVADWYCGFCEVAGRDRGGEPNCWNCGEAVTVTAWSLVLADSPESGQKNKSPHDNSALPPVA